MADFNNTLTDRVTNEEAEAKIQEMNQAQNRHMWTIRHEYKRFVDSLQPGIQFKARLVTRYCATNAQPFKSRRAIFTVVKRYFYTMLVEVYDGAYKYICSVNVKDLWIDGQALVVVPVRRENIC